MTPREETGLGSLYDYNARFYSVLGRFLSADTIVPDGKNPQAFNRYSYVNNNPLRYTDPTGHAYAECLAFAPAGGWVGPAICVGIEFTIDVVLIVSVAQALEQNELVQQGRQQALEQLEPISLEEAAIRIVARNPIAGPIAREATEQYLSNVLDDLGDITNNLLSKKDNKQTQEKTAKRVPMPGAKGTRIMSKTVWKGGQQGRIDVENPNPGNRPGQIHFQLGKEKYLYDLAKGIFRDSEGNFAPRYVNDLLERSDVQYAIDKALRMLGETQ